VSIMSDHEHDGPHIMPLKTYYTVFAALLCLTVVTVGVSYLGLPPTLSVVVALLVASTKATLVAAWFMHLKYDTKFNVFVFLSAIWFAGSFFTFTFIDLTSRGRMLKIEDNFELRQDRADFQ